MEPISAIASFIAIGQALAATPKIFRVLCSLVEVRQEVTQLLHEIAMLDELWNRIKQIKNIPDDDPTARFSVPRAHLLQVIETDLGSIVTQLEELAEKFQRGTKENGKLKVDRVKWLLKRREIASLSKRAKKNREYLQEILICESFFTSTSNGSMLMEIRTMMTTQVRTGNNLLPPSINQGHRIHEIESHSTDNSDDCTISEVTDASTSLVSIATPTDDSKQSNLTSITGDGSLQMSPNGQEFQNHEQLIQMTTTLRRACPKKCACRCHLPTSRPRSHPAMSPIYGWLNYAYNSVPQFGVRRCDTDTCRRAHSPVRFNLRFPLLFCSRVLEASMSLGALAGAGASLHLRVARPIPGCADIWQEIYYGKTERVRLSVACGQISPIDGDAKRSVLDYAITWYQYEIALMFLEESASTLSGSDVGKRSAIRARRELCFNEPHRDRGAYILQKVIALDDENAEDCWPIHEVVRCGGNLTEILEGSTEGIDALDNLGNAPLHWAVDEGDDTAIRTLITYGANPNIRDSDNRTPLMDAVRQPQLNCADALISGGCDVNASDHEGYNALYSALDSSKKGTAKMLSFLINHGAQLTDYYGGNMVHWLAQYPGTAEAEEKFRILILAGVDLIGKDDDGYTPLMRALRENNEVMLRLLLDAGCRFDATPTMDNALIDAASFANAGSMDILEETRFTVDVRVQDKDGDTPLDIFEWRMGTDHSELPGEYMPPPDDDVKAFGRLLQGVRDRYLTAEIETLETVIQHLKGQESTLAREVLQPVIQEKFYWNIPAEHRTFRAIDVQIKEAMMEAAIESLEEFVDVSRARIGTDPFEGSYCRKSGLRDKGLVVDAS